MVEPTDICELKTLIYSLFAKVGCRKTCIDELEAEIAQLRVQNAEILIRLTQNSANFQKSSASDGYAKKSLVKADLHKQISKNSGGQTGRRGQTLKMVEQPDPIHIYHPTQCRQYVRQLTGEGQQVAHRHVFDLIQPKLWTREHQLRDHQHTCGCVQTGQLLAHVVVPVLYNPCIKTKSVIFNVNYRLLFAKVSQHLAALKSYAHNPATLLITKIVTFERLAPNENQLKTHLAAAPIYHFDEAGVRVRSKLHWLHVACAPAFTYSFVHPRRRQSAICSKQSVFDNCYNSTVHNCWASYFTTGKNRHDLYGANLSTEIQALIEQGCPWANALHAYLLKAYQATQHGYIVLTGQAQWREHYELLCQLSDEQKLPALVFFKADSRTGSSKRSKGCNLLEQLIHKQKAVLSFAFEPDKQTERALSPVKVKQTVSKCFPILAEAARYARVSDFISTMRKNKLIVFNQLICVSSGSLIGLSK